MNTLVRALTLSTALLTGCLELDASPELGETADELEIATDDWSTPQRNAVVLVNGNCTGTLIAPDLVISAAHCGYEYEDLADGAWHRNPGGAIRIDFGPDRSAPIHTAWADYITIPPIATAGPWLLDDIVMFKLRTQVPPDIAVPRDVAVSRPAISSSSAIYQIGYGGGRDRRYAGGSNYRDWLTDPDLLVNAFIYDMWITGPGIGDRDNNLEGGDSGGPMVLGNSLGPVIGVLSHWAPYGIATFGPGGEGRPSIRGWLIPELNNVSDYGWAWAGNATGTYVASSLYSHAPYGAPTISHVTTGRYRVTFPDAGHAQNPTVQVAAYGTDNLYCKGERVQSLGDDLVIDVACYRPMGGRANSRFAVSWIRRHDAPGSAVAYLTTSGFGATVASQWSTAAGAASTVTRTGTGAYTVVFGGLTSSYRTTVQVTAIGAGSARCKVSGWAGGTATIVCHDANGNRINSDFSAFYTTGRTPHASHGAYAWLNVPVATSYTPSSSYQYTSNGATITAGTLADNRQWTRFPGLAPYHAAPQVTAYGTDASYCKLTNWYGSSTETTVYARCYDATGAQAPSRATVAYLTP